MEPNFPLTDEQLEAERRMLASLPPSNSKAVRPVTEPKEKAPQEPPRINDKK